MAALPDPHVAPPPPVATLDTLSRLASQVAFETVDLASFLDMVEAASQAQVAGLRQARMDADAIGRANQAVIGAVQTVATNAAETPQTVRTSTQEIATSLGGHQRYGRMGRSR
jgi:hypothetical protein